MYDRASLAEASIKGRYDENVAVYDESMRQSLLREQEIVTEMRSALSGGQFEVWLQPQFNHSSRALIGAEALVRWRHPKRGLISPGVFIPVFERNGFIYELDKFVWNETARLLRSWIDKGFSPLPVSVNISRYDLLRDDIVEAVCAPVERYSLPEGILRLEITESAFMGENRRIIDAVAELNAKGFTVEIDDFGSGYSSLNTLKDVPADILKLDMRFLENGLNPERGGNILESIVRMARWLGIPVIAEGVETVKQAEFLKSIGCYYIQGFLYARPMPSEEYERFFKSYSKERILIKAEAFDIRQTESIWDPASMETFIFNSFAGGACIFEYFEGKLDLLRVNESYARELGGRLLSASETFATTPERCLDAENMSLMLSAIQRAIESGRESECELRLDNINGKGTHAYVRFVYKLMAKAGDRALIYCTAHNMDAIREAQNETLKRIKQTVAQERELLDELPCGAGLFTFSEKKLRAVYLNKRYFELVGRDAADPAKANVPDFIHPDERVRVMSEIEGSLSSGAGCCTARLLCGAGDGYRNFRISFRTLQKGDGMYSIYAALTRLSDEAEQPWVLPQLILSSIMDSTQELSFAKDKHLRYICASRPFVRMVKLERESDIIGKTDYDLFEKPVADKYRADDLRLFEAGDSIVDMIEAIPSEDGVQHYSHTSKYLLRDDAGNIIGMYGAGRDITEYHDAFEQLKLLNESIPGGIASFELSESGLRNIYFNEGFYSYTGYTREEYRRLIESDPFSLVFKEDLPPIQEGLRAVLRGEVNEGSFNCRYYLKNGGHRWMNIRGVLSESHISPLVINMIKVDITERKALEEQIRMSEEQYRLAMEQSGLIMCRFDVEDLSVNMSAKVADVFGTPQKVRGVPYSPVRMGSVSADSTNAYIDFFEGIIRGEKTGSAEFEALTTMGWRWLKANQSSVFNDNGEPVYAVISVVDNTERHRREQEHARLLQNERMLQEIAETDELTRVYNRKGAEKKIKKLLGEPRRAGCTLLIVDMDDLKVINDTFGHPQGDRAIKMLADTLRTHFRHSDIIGRVGGDEFIVLLDGVSDRIRISEMLLLLIERTGGNMVGERNDFSICISIGAAVCEDGAASFEEMYSRADRALYYAKRHGKKQFAFFTEDMS